MTSKPLSVAAAGVGLAVSLDVDDGVAEGDSLGEGEGEGVGVVAGGLMVNKAHGLGGTLAHSLCCPGPSPANGFTFTLTKLPLASAVAFPATLLVVSQKSDMGSLGRNWPPVTVITVLTSPAVTSSEMNALAGQGGTPDAGAGQAARTPGEFRKRNIAEAAAASTTATGASRIDRGSPMKRRNDTRLGLVTSGATGGTTPMSAAGTATSD